MNKPELKTQKPVFQGPWEILVKITNVLCSDGEQRVFRPSSPNDNAYGHVQVKGKTVTGFISWDYDNEAWVFSAYVDLKNAYLLPSEWK